MNFLFVCKHNRFRSKVAEALFKKLAGGSVEVKSAGVRLDLMRPYVAENAKKVLREKGVDGADDTPREINDLDIRWADRIIVVANNVSPEIFPKEKTEVWETEDTDQDNLEMIRKIVDKIEIKVKDLVKRLDLKAK